MPYKFSSSTLSLMDECQRCFWLHFRANLKRPDGIFPSLPNGMDRVLKQHFDSFRERKMLPPELKQLNEYKLFENKELLEKWRNYLAGIRWTDENGNVLMGAVDNILQKGSKLVVLDYKTRGYPLKDDTHEYYQDQMDIYNFLLRKNGYETEEYAYLLFYHPDKVTESGEVLFHTDLIKIAISVKNAEEIMRKALQVLDGDIPKADEECGYCRWQNIKMEFQDTLK